VNNELELMRMEEPWPIFS